MELTKGIVYLIFQRSSDDGEEKVPKRFCGDAHFAVLCLLFIMLRSNDKRFHMGNHGLSYIGRRSSDMRPISADSHSISGINMFISIERYADHVRSTGVLD